jgi:tellurite resistance protein TerB
MFGFGKKAAAAKAEMKKFERRDLMQATVAGCFLIASADGEIEKTEIEKMEQLLQANPAMAMFGGELRDTISRFEAAFKVSRVNGRKEAMREINDIKASPTEVEDVFVAMLTIAEADGEIEEAERKVLVDIGQKLGVRLADYELAA